MEAADEAKLRQFEVLWAEVARRSNAQQTLIAATVTATGAVGGVIAGDDVDSALLLVLALVAPVFGLLWVDHARNITEIGRFIASGWSWEPNWEAAYATNKTTRSGRWRFCAFVLAITIVFLAPAIAGLVTSFPRICDDPLVLAGWIMGAVLTALFLAGWGAQAWSTNPGRREKDDD